MHSDSIADSLDREYAPAWRPASGDKLVGIITELGERGGYDDQPYPIVTVRNDDDPEFAVHAFHAVLRNELAKLRPRVGDRLGVKYLGRLKTADGRGQYHGYRVRVSGSSAASGVNWGRYNDERPVVPVPSQRMAETAADDDLPF